MTINQSLNETTAEYWRGMTKSTFIVSSLVSMI